ncbi:hypothetical protein TrVFT333_003463 [Trichoderma virens FT-333]|nr:hypothetical protein TrVFT333_003463 [Trichoderma virens FT-333]
MLVKSDKHVPSFNSLPVELLLQIWEMAIELPRVLRIMLTTDSELARPTPALIRSTATARAAVSVDRLHRYIILRYLLPNTIPVVNKAWIPSGVARYNAAKEIIYINWPLIATFASDLMVKRSAQNWRIRDPGEDETAQRIGSTWMQHVQKLALDPEIELRSVIRRMLRAQCIIHCEFHVLKQLYIVCPTFTVPDLDARDAEEESRPRSTPQDTPQNTPQEMTLEMFMEMKSKPPAPEQNDDAWLHNGTYTGVYKGDTYLSGKQALEWLGPKRSKTALIRKVENYNRQKEEMSKKRGSAADPAAEMKAGILLHIIGDGGVFS